MSYESWTFGMRQEFSEMFERLALLIRKNDIRGIFLRKQSWFMFNICYCNFLKLLTLSSYAYVVVFHIF